ncbi:MAG: hypothetical protein HY278_00150 [candidate division NC10 bacterium]|nr:hypothetical protein [candidate division NC10 bacterium]
MTEGQKSGDEAVREQVRAAVEAIEGALRGIVNFLTPLKPTLRNELIQLLGKHVDQARTAKESLERLLADLER